MRSIEALLERLPACSSAQLRQFFNCGGSFTDGIYQVACVTLLDHFRHRTVRPRDHRCAARKSFDHNQAERLRPVNWKERSGRLANQFVLVVAADLSQEFHLRSCVAEHRLNHGFVIRTIFIVDFGCDFKLVSRSQSDFNRTIESLLRRHAPYEQEIVFGQFTKTV